MEVDAAAIERNYAETRRRAGARRVLASIKANAYGHGVLDVARLLEGLGVFGLWTGHVREALALRQAGITAKIVLFGGYLPDAIPDLAAHDLIPTVYDAAGVAAAARAAGRRPLAVYVKVDAGLGRLGVPLSKARTLIRSLRDVPGLRVEGVYTHLPFRDRDGQKWAEQAAAGFERLLGELRADGITPEVTQVWGSSGLLAGLADSTNAVCVGHLLYGLSPLATPLSRADGFHPACTGIKAALIHVGQSEPEEVSLAVSGGYGRGRNGRTGVVALGAGDGMRGGRGAAQPDVLVRGMRAPVIGVSLEHAVLDLSGCETAQIGDEVVVVGEAGGDRITPNDWAAWLGSTPLDILMAFSGRLDCRLRRTPPDLAMDG